MMHPEAVYRRQDPAAEAALNGYREAEQTIMRAIAVRFDLHLELSLTSVKALDLALLMDERDQAMSAPPQAGTSTSSRSASARVLESVARQTRVPVGLQKFGGGKWK